MKKLIDAEEAFERIRKKAAGYDDSMFATNSECNIARIVALECARIIQSMFPDAIAEKSYWIDMAESSKDVPKYKCSKCGFVRIGLRSNYCENCGTCMLDGNGEE